MIKSMHLLIIKTASGRLLHRECDSIPLEWMAKHINKGGKAAVVSDDNKRGRRTWIWKQEEVRLQWTPNVVSGQREIWKECKYDEAVRHLGITAKDLGAILIMVEL